MILGKKIRPSGVVNIHNIKVNESDKIILLRFTLDNHLIFEDYKNNVCQTTICKLHTLQRIRKLTCA